MANIIKVYFRVRGSKNNCLLFLQEDIHVADDINVVAENGTNEDYMIYAETECKWSVSGSLIEPEYGNSMQDISRKLGINIEIVGIDPYEPLGL